jgi:hypothetical protein
MTWRVISAGPCNAAGAEDGRHSTGGRFSSAPARTGGGYANSGYGGGGGVGHQGLGVIENQPSTDIKPLPSRVCVSIHPKGQSISTSAQIFVLNDPPARWEG